MRIALLADSIWPDKIGGMQKHTYYLLKYLAKQQINVDFYYAAQNHKAVIDSFIFDESLYIKFIKIEFPTSIAFPGHYIYNSYRFSKNIFHKLKSEEPYSFIYAQGFTGWYLAKKKLPVGSNLHGLEMYQLTTGLKNKCIQYLMRFPAGSIIKNSKICFSLGGNLSGILKQQRAKKIVETPIGIDTSWLCKPTNKKDKITFLFVGRQEWRKGLSILYDALGGIEANKYLFHFVGVDKPSRDMPSSCIFHGEVNEENRIKEIFKNADVLVCPSLAEGMPTVILEAMAQGKAIIATDVGATRLLVNNENGILIQPNNVNELQNALSDVINMQEPMLQQWKENSCRRVEENFLWSKSIITTIDGINNNS